MTSRRDKKCIPYKKSKYISSNQGTSLMHWLWTKAKMEKIGSARWSRGIQIYVRE
jgi:hypothetical protein